VDYYRHKLVVLTGASSGIGLAAARLLRSWGAHLILIARNEERLAAARAEVERFGPRGADAPELHTLSLDIRDRKAVEAAVASLPSQRPVEVLINNAGYATPGYFEELGLETFDEMMSTNFMGALYLTKAILPGMLARSSGHVGFVSSLVGLMGVFGYTAYAPSKFALRGLAESLRLELKPRGIRVSICYPADTDTPGYANENRTKPDETRAIEGKVKIMPPEEAARKLLEGMAAGKFHILCSGNAWFAEYMYRLFPWMVRSMFDSSVAKARGAKPAPAARSQTS
jgi:3-dehydrosphinganine reductase